MTLVFVADAVSRIVSAVKDAGLVPQQIVLGVSEKEVITQLNMFSSAVRQLKQAGISLSIDNFGDGSAGLSLLVNVQPDGVRISATIVRDIHRSGPKQACCSGYYPLLLGTGD